MARIYGSGSGTYGSLSVYVDYSVSTDEENNRSYVTANFYASGSSGGSYPSGCNSSFSVGGVSGTGQKSNGSFNFSGTNSLGSFSGYFTHDENGERSIRFSGSFTFYFEIAPGTSVSASGSISRTIALPSIEQGGVYAKVNGAWVKGTVYAKVNGAWVKGKPYAKIGGEWRASK